MKQKVSEMKIHELIQAEVQKRLLMLNMEAEIKLEMEIEVAKQIRETQ